MTLLRNAQGVDIEINLRFHVGDQAPDLHQKFDSVSAASKPDPVWYVECKDCGKWAGKYDSQEKANRALSSHRINCPKYEYGYGVVDEAKLWISAMHERRV